VTSAQQWNSEASSVFVFEVHLEQIFDVDLRHVIHNVPGSDGQGLTKNSQQEIFQK